MEIPEVIREKAAHRGLTDLEYVIKVWTLLEGMKPGDIIVIEKITKAETRDAFIDSVKLYMDEHRDTYMDGLSFRNGFKELAKYDLSFTQGRKTPTPARE